MDKRFAWIGIISLLLSFGGARAQDDSSSDKAETTIRLMGAADGELPEVVTRDIALPESLPEDSAAVEKAQAGLEKASENRRRREAGLATADAARENGAEMADDAQENRESRGRSEDHIPEGAPGPPDNPGPPGG